MSTPPRRRPGRLALLLERARLRPTALAVFAASAALLAALELGSPGSLRAPAVATAPSVDHPSPVATVVEQVHVRAGDHVEAGAPLVTLSSRFVDRSLALVDAELEALGREARLAQLQLARDDGALALRVGGKVTLARAEAERARAEQTRRGAVLSSVERAEEETKARNEQQLAREQDVREARYLVERERAVAEEASKVARTEVEKLRELEQVWKSRPGAGLISQASAELFEARRDVLERQRAALLDDARRLTVTALTKGRVGTVPRVGATVAQGGSVLSLLPDSAVELVAYVPPETDPALLVAGAPVRLTAQRLTAACAKGGAVVLRRGAQVELAPGQLGNPIRHELWGLPVYASLPEGCELGVGQALQVELAAAHY